MKDKWPSFFALVFNVCICICAFILIIDAYRVTKYNDKEHIIYKNYSSYVEFSNGKSIDLYASNKNISEEKYIVIRNNGENPMYIDITWNSLDLNGSEESFAYEITGKSYNKTSNPSSKNSNVPSMTSDGILMGEKIEVGDTITYKIKISPTIDSLSDDHLYASIAVNVRRK